MKETETAAEAPAATEETPAEAPAATEEAAKEETVSWLFSIYHLIF